MKDALGHELEVGDLVMVSTGDGNTLSLCQAIGFTPKKVQVYCVETIFNYDFYWGDKLLEPRQMLKAEL